MFKTPISHVPGKMGFMTQIILSNMPAIHKKAEIHGSKNKTKTELILHFSYPH